MSPVEKAPIRIQSFGSFARRLRLGQSIVEMARPQRIIEAPIRREAPNIPHPIPERVPEEPALPHAPERVTPPTKQPVPAQR